MAPPNDGPGSIYSRNKNDCIEASTQLFRLLCDDSSRRAKSLSKYTTEDLIVAGLDGSLKSSSPPPTSSPSSSSSSSTSGSVYARKTEPTSLDFLKEDFEPWTAYRMHDDPQFVEIDMMSSALTYRVTVWRKNSEGTMEETEAICTSVWKQGAGSDWKCCVHHMSRA